MSKLRSDIEHATSVYRSARYAGRLSDDVMATATLRASVNPSRPGPRPLWRAMWSWAAAAMLAFATFHAGHLDVTPTASHTRVADHAAEAPTDAAGSPTTASNRRGRQTQLLAAGPFGLPAFTMTPSRPLRSSRPAVAPPQRVSAPHRHMLPTLRRSPDPPFESTWKPLLSLRKRHDAC